MIKKDPILTKHDQSSEESTENSKKDNRHLMVFLFFFSIRDSFFIF